MDGRDSIQSLLVRRKLTRAIADVARAQMLGYLAVLAPLLRPRAVLGDFIHGNTKEGAPRAEKAYKELQASYAAIAPSRPFHLTDDLTPPLSFAGNGLDITPVEYPHAIGSGDDARTIMVRRPFTWSLTYAGYAPTRLPDLVATRTRASDALQQFVLSHLLLRVVIDNSPGLESLLEAVHFPLTTTTTAATGTLPVTRIGFVVGTTLPRDEVILETAELTGMDAFEEVINFDDLKALDDPFRDRVYALARQHAPGVV
ncbi:hypothetical protein LuPra_01320 [Luteitalea pratensis]|uniref:Uncharacterized protein n=1 Tax=Luteitalea pratensis TaxID=1855912 RepID=A0A143PHS1_LUTPR|nr:hypothetical protein [Luteitalea pratensis]AMY08132.1 hypothetical protein LuPra_01320 [Luteitalea pratensis]